MGYTKQQLQEMGFYEINKALASRYLQCEYQFNDELLSVELIDTETHLGCHGIPYENIVEYGEFDYRKLNDIMPLAFDHRIAIVPHVKKLYIAHFKRGKGQKPLSYFDQNPLRAIACLLLMMD